MMLIFHLISCVVCVGVIIAVILTLEDRLRTPHRVCLGLMAAGMILSSWAAFAKLSATDGWVFVVFRIGLAGHLVIQYAPQLRAEVLRRLREEELNDLPEPLRWLNGLIQEPPGYDTLKRPVEPRRPE